jgi:hypothetical protein
VLTTGVAGRLQCLDKRTGKVLWTEQLWSKVIELRRNGLQTTATELWSSNRLRLHHGNAIRRHARVPARPKDDDGG